MARARRQLLEVVGDGERGERPDGPATACSNASSSSSRPPRSSPAAGSSSARSGAVGDQPARQHDARALPLRQAREEPGRELVGARPPRARRRARSTASAGSSSASRIDPIKPGEDDVDRALLRIEAAPERRLDEADPPAQLVQRHPSEPAPSTQAAPRSAASEPRRSGAASSCRRRSGRRSPSARPRPPSSRSRRGSPCGRRASCARGRPARTGRSRSPARRLYWTAPGYTRCHARSRCHPGRRRSFSLRFSSPVPARR